MFIKFIKNHEVLSIVLFYFAGIFLWFRIFIAPVSGISLAEEEHMPLAQLILNFFKDLPFWAELFGFLLVLLNSFLITRISSVFILFKKGSALPGVLYLLIVSSWNVLQSLHPVHFASLCILISIFYIFSTYQRELEVSATFNSSFFLSLAALFYLPAVILLPVMWISIFILQKSDNWRLILIPLFGFLVPWIFVFAIAFMNDNLWDLFSHMNAIIWAENSGYLLKTRFLVLSADMVLLILLGSFSFMTTYQYIKVSSRKYFVVFYWMLGIIGISALAFSSIGIEIIALVTIPGVFISSIFFLSGEKYFWKEIILLVLIGLLIFNYSREFLIQ